MMAILKRMEFLLTLVGRLSASEQAKLCAKLRATQPCLLRQLNDDVLSHILIFLMPPDRMNLLTALFRSYDTESTRRLMLGRSIMSAHLLAEVALQSLVSGVYFIANRILYTIRGSHVKTYVFCNWTPFCRRPKAYSRMCAVVYWSAVYPHARVDFDEDMLRCIAVYELRRYNIVIRLTAHTETGQNAPDCFRVRVGRKGLVLRTPPLHHHVVDMFSMCKWASCTNILHEHDTRQHIGVC